AAPSQGQGLDSAGGTAKLSDISARPEPVAGQTEAQVKQETRPQAVADKLKEAQQKEADSKAQDPIWSTLNRFSSYWNLRGRSPFAENIPLRPTPTRRQAMVQGFKIHVDIRHSDPHAISQMLERILRILNKEQVSSKVIKSVPLAQSVLGSFQAGKTITIYPYYVDDAGEVVFISSGEWHRLVSEIDDALMQWKIGSPTFRDRQGERVIGDSGRIGYRFGGFTSDVIFEEPSMAKTGPLSPDEFIFDIRQDSSHHVEQDHTQWRSDMPPPGSGVVRQAPAQLPLEQAFQDYKKPSRAYGAASEFFSNLFPGKKTQVRALINLERPSIFMMVQDFIMRLFSVRTITYKHVRAEQSQRRLMFTATIGGKPWMFKVMEYGGRWDPALGKVDNAAQIDWVKELIITEIARQQGFLDNVAANNPVDFLRATGMPEVASQLQRAALAKDYDAISEIMRRYFMFGSDPVVVMRQVPGASAWKEPAKMTQAHYRDAMKQLRTLVDILHKHGIMHRDIKPANILLERTGLFGLRERVVLIDFENAALISDGKIQSAPLEMETPYYAFPFQNRNFFTLLDERTQERWFRFHDEFALSVMDYEQRSGLRVAEMFGRRDWMYLRQEFYLFLPGRTTLQDLMNDPSLTIKTYLDPSLQKTIQRSASKDDQDNNRLAQPVQDRPSSSPMDNAAGEKIGVSPQEGIPGGIDLSSPSKSGPQLDKGGIDLNPKNLDIEVKGDDTNKAAMTVPFDLQHFEGFTFTILKIEAIDDGSKIFGFTPAQEEEASLAKR
ncbi:MAG: lipopolysaccharide kinase InaA family protein, partial [Candidatus Omnitrophota bacterium]